MQIIENKINELKNVSFKLKQTKNKDEYSKLNEKLKNIVKGLKQEVITKFKDESDIKHFLDNIAKFNNYSANNQCLIWLQRPEAEYVNSFRKYKELGYHVKKGAKGIAVLVPNFFTIVKITDIDGNISYCPYYKLTENEIKIYKDKADNSIEFYSKKLSGFSVGYVFDIKDTDMPKNVLNELNPIVNDKGAEEVIGFFIKAIYRDGFKVKFDNIVRAKGYCDHQNNLIVVKSGLGSLMSLKVLIHEYAHALAHKHLKNNNKDYEDNRNQYETEAEAIAYTVSRYLGLPTMEYSLDYLYSWSKQKDFKEIDESFTTIINYSNRIIRNFTSFYSRELDLDIYGVKFNNI